VVILGLPELMHYKYPLQVGTYRKFAKPLTPSGGDIWTKVALYQRYTTLVDGCDV